MPSFSIVIPLYNKEIHVSRAIDSVLNQEIEDFEVLVVDDGSTDGSAEIVARYSDPRIRLIGQPNSGRSAARNKGIFESTAPYVAFLDADDTWDTDFLKIIEKLVQDFPGAGAYAAHIRDSRLCRNGHFDLYDSSLAYDSWLIQNYFDCLSSGYYPVSSSSVCVRRSVLLDMNGFDESLEIGEDTDTWIRIFLQCGIAISNRYAATYYFDAENRSIHMPDHSLRELQFYSHLRGRYLNESLDQHSFAVLDEWTTRGIYNLIIRSAYNGEKRFAARILQGHWQDLNGYQRFLGLTRVCVPNALVELLKHLRSRRRERSFSWGKGAAK